MKNNTPQLEKTDELLDLLKDLGRLGIMWQLLDPEQIRILREGKGTMQRVHEADEKWRAEKKRQFEEEAPLREAERKRIEDERGLCITARKDIGKGNELLTRIVEVLERLCEKVEKMPAPIVIPPCVPQSPINPLPNPYPHGPYGPWGRGYQTTVTSDSRGEKDA